MTVSAFLQSNFTTQDATTYKSAIDGNFSVLSRLGAAFSPSAQATPNMTVLVAAGQSFNGSLSTVAAQSTGTITAPVTNPRIDRVVMDAVTGSISVITGTEAASPSAPAITAGKLPVCQVLLQTTSTSITNSMITDERIFLPVSQINGTAIPASSTLVTTTTLGNNTLPASLTSLAVSGGPFQINASAPAGSFLQDLNGYVGIAQSVPSSFFTPDLVVGNTTGNHGISIIGAPTTGAAILSFGYGIGTAAGSISNRAKIWYDSASDTLRMSNGGSTLSTAQFVISGAGHILVNTATELGYTLNVNGTGYFSSYFGCNGATPAAPATGYGTPTGGSHQTSFAAGTITLANLAAAVAQLIVDLKATGLIAA